MGTIRDTLAGDLAEGLREMPPNSELRARLRRGRDGQCAPIAATALTALVDIQGADPDLLNDALLVAALVADTRVTVRFPAEPTGSLGADLHEVRRRRQPAAQHLLGATMDRLLGADREGLPQPLRRALSTIARDELSVDVAALVRDLGEWDAEDRHVQRAWAYAFCGGSDDDEPDVLDRIRDLSQTRDAQLRIEVAAARATGHSWAQIGEALGVSKQAAQQRYRS